MDTPIQEVLPMSKVVTVQAQQKWEYCLETRKTETALIIALNDLGQHGWELINVLYYKDFKGIMSWTAFLKRPDAGLPAKAPGEEAAHVAGTPAAAHADDKTASLHGFDLSGDEFGIRAE